MIFGDIETGSAEGAILVHSVRLPGTRLNKGRVLSADDVAVLAAAGLDRVTVVRLEPGDVPENEAAAQIAAKAAGTQVEQSAAFTGRANLIAACDGLAVIDADRVSRFNLLHESLTIATVPTLEPVERGQLIATIKIIPFAAPRSALDAGLAVLAEGAPLVRVAPWRSRTVGLVSTFLPGGKDSLLDKSKKVLTDRLAALGEHRLSERRCPHTPDAVAQSIRGLLAEGCDAVLIFGASAIVDRRDVVPAGIIAAGGEVLHFGMPVDPGNLLLLGRHGDVPVIGLPGCARSPKLNGFDWVLQRLMADIPVTPKDIMQMGAGGLLKEIPNRPQPRQGAERATPRKARTIAVLLLAAGQSRRLGSRNKLLAEIGGVPLVRRVAEQGLASRAEPCVVVTGHEADAVRAALSGCETSFVHNSEYAKGLSGSLRAGLQELGDEIEGVLICLGDMPEVRAEHLDRLIAAFDPDEGREICVPTHNGKRGNPVLFGARFFPEMMGVAGDVGARHLIGQYSDLVCEIPMDDPAILLDLDTPQSLADYEAAQVR